ncbi:MAG: hypothetical protein HC893_14345 [Chloroflexaceae bacterium]|nr:hypothetical protein [Chloroflexaceae bacterium]
MPPLFSWLAEKKRPHPLLFGLSIIMMVVFPPMVGHLRLGQFTLFMTLLMLLLARHLTNHTVLMPALMLVLMLTKPQLSILVLPGFCLAYYRLHGMRQTVSLLGTAAGWGLLLCVPLFLAAAKWPQDFIHQLQNNPDWKQPSTFDMMRIQFGQTGIALWGLIALIGFGLNLRWWWQLPAHDAVLWSLALTPLITPYIWSWDFVLLLPLAITSTKGWMRRLGQGWKRLHRLVYVANCAGRGAFCVAGEG